MIFKLGYIFFLHLMLDKLLLQSTIHVWRLGDDEQSASTHVQAMGNLAVRIALLHYRLNRIVTDTAWYRQHATGFIDNK